MRSLQYKLDIRTALKVSFRRRVLYILILQAIAVSSCSKVSSRCINLKPVGPREVRDIVLRDFYKRNLADSGNSPDKTKKTEFSDLSVMVEDGDTSLVERLLIPRESRMKYIVKISVKRNGSVYNETNQVSYCGDINRD